MRRSALAIPIMLALGLAIVVPASAQDTSHPAGIYVGSCPVPGNALVSLWDASRNFLVDGEADSGESVGTQAGFPVEASVTIVEIALADLVATEHAILVHRSPSELDDYLVCGDIGGLMLGADELPVALAPVGLSPWSGVAILDDEGNGTTTVSLFVFEGPGIDTGAVPSDPVPSPRPTRSPGSASDDRTGGGNRGTSGDDDDRGDDDDDDDGDDDDDDDGDDDDD